ncbi:trans-sulfuration enzyme family protein [Kineococcus rhizosphaerae]|uniref:trans-sulfuration enzyme family protein n=1 Tax=Kineococcus rhizosphaerae TaxID=559628 RepID=UPI000D04B4F4|nr:PLP-dependent transferase [Kineococcus rhizosphaerae]
MPENVSPTPLSPNTVAVVSGRPARALDSELNTPVSLSATYVGGGSLGAADLGYGRFGNPTWAALETAIGELEGGRALTFASGMAAVAAALHLVPADGTVLVPHGAYNGTHSLTGLLAAQGRLSVQPVDITDVDAVRTALGSVQSPVVLWLESPTNPLLEVADLAALAAAGHERGAVVVVDNTFATPLLQRPLDLGADVVVHSVTKFLSGHSDVVLGAVVARDEQLLTALAAHRTLHGAIPGPLEAFLALRGLRTLPLRLERAQANAADLARRLQDHPAVTRVRHPSLPADPGHALAKEQMLGFGALVSIEVAGGAAGADAVVDAVRLWVPATSLGGVESLVERRRRHAGEPHVVPVDLLRLSVGVEDVEDLWRDLSAALDAALDAARDTRG